MALYLVQHGKSLPKEVDPEQGLSKKHCRVERIAQVAKDMTFRSGKFGTAQGAGASDCGPFPYGPDAAEPTQSWKSWTA